MTAIWVHQFRACCGARKPGFLLQKPWKYRNSRPTVDGRNLAITTWECNWNPVNNVRFTISTGDRRIFSINSMVDTLHLEPGICHRPSSLTAIHLQPTPQLASWPVPSHLVAPVGWKMHHTPLQRVGNSLRNRNAVVSQICFLGPYLEKWSNLTLIF